MPMHTQIPVPEAWLNLAALLPSPLPIARFSDGQTVSFDGLAKIYSEECARIELLDGPYGADAWIPIPEEVAREYAKYRPTPVHRARGFEKAIGYAGAIYCKREDLSPTGSHKPNTAIPQAYYARKQGLAELITDTGAGQWGCALGWSCHNLGVRCTVFMTRNSYSAKPYRRYLMQLAGATAIASPSPFTKCGRALFEQDPGHPGSLGIGMSEAMEMVAARPDARLALGCMSYYAALHQTVIGIELAGQLQEHRVEPDLAIGCVGGGTNFTGFISPFAAARFGHGPWRCLLYTSPPRGLPGWCGAGVFPTWARSSSRFCLSTSGTGICSRTRSHTGTSHSTAPTEMGKTPCCATWRGRCRRLLASREDGEPRSARRTSRSIFTWKPPPDTPRCRSEIT